MGSSETQAMSAARLTLIAGVMISFVFMISGLVLQGVSSEGVMGIDPGLLLEVGIVILLGTPVVRVLVLALGMLRARETSFALVAFCILLLLGASVAIGMRGE